MKKYLIALFSLSFLVLASAVNAQTYTDTFTKDGMTYITTKTVTSDKVTIVIQIYDSNGTLVNTKTTTKTPKTPPEKDATTTFTKESGTAVKVTPTPTPVEEQQEVMEQNQERNTVANSFVQSNFPMYVSSTSGNLVVQTASTDVELKAKPESIVEKARNAGMDIIGDVQLAEVNQQLRYVVNGTKVERLFAIIQIPLDTKLIYDTQTGDLVQSQQSGLTKVADFFSI